MARKYRPMGFEDVVAQQHVTTTLTNAINSGRIGHAYLFAGPRGTGKTTVARILAKALNCIQGPTSKPCNKCQFCEEVNIGRSLDVIEIDGASNNSVEDVRALRENVRYTPASGKYKVYIIDEVHMLSDSAFNALLKTLEEPPKHVVFIFATTEPHEVPATVLSRCQRFDFRRIPIKDLMESINKIADKEKIEIEQEAGFILAHKADGSLRDILSLLDQVISYGGKKITAELVNQTLGLVDISFLFEMENAIRQKDSNKVLSLLEEFINAGGDLEEFVHGLLEHFRNLLIAKISQNRKEIFELSEEHIKKYQDEAKDLAVGDILRMIKIAADLNLALKRSNEPRTYIEIALIKLSNLDSSIKLEEILEGLKSLKSGCDNSEKSSSIENSPTQSKANNPTVVSPRKTGDISFSQIQAKWDKILEKVKKNKTSLWSCLVEGELSCMEGDSLVLEFHNGRKFHKQQVEKKENLKLIGDTINEIFGFSVRIKTTMDEAKNSPFKHQLMENKKPNKSDVDSSRRSPDKIVEEEPNLKEILDVLDGELLTGDEKPI
jgi:DNA polymerase-3 subunit gamma/tau